MNSLKYSFVIEKKDICDVFRAHGIEENLNNFKLLEMELNNSSNIKKLIEGIVETQLKTTVLSMRYGELGEFIETKEDTKENNKENNDEK